MTRGHLRIYLGAAPGVGKTVDMLSEGHRRLARGTDVVVGLCESHGREYTASLLEGLEVIPRRAIEYRGKTFEEMDLDAILARRPTVALVDELAHSNVPGSRHEKRYQDVLDLLDAGIDVITTVNIQHLESLNDAVARITGIVQHETVPDEIVRAADQIDLVDMSPDALRRRLSHGHVYRADQVDAALANYFRVGNLAALRELALLWMADKVEAGLTDYRSEHAINQSWPTRERVVVALSGRPGGEALLRRGARIASRLAGGRLMAVYITRSDGLLTAPPATEARLRAVTRELGGEFHTVTGDDPTKALLDFARGVSATQIIVGTNGRPGWLRGFTRSFAQQVIAEAGDIDVHVVNHRSAGLGFDRRRTRGLSAKRIWGGVALAILVPLILTYVLRWAGEEFTLTADVPIFLLATVVVAVVGGLWPALVAAIWSSLLLNWFFVAPVDAFTVYNPDNVLALFVFVAVGLIVAAIVQINAIQSAAARTAQRESVALAFLSHSLLGTTEQMPLLLRRAVDMFGARGAALVEPSAFGAPGVVASEGTFDPAAPYDHEVVDDKHELVLQPPGLSSGQRRVFAACAAHAAAILQRETLVRAAARADSVSRDNAAKTALLSAVAHDLRTPLATMRAAIKRWRDPDVTLTAADEADLKTTMAEAAARLDLVIGNLLHMSRLQAGGVVAHPERTDVCAAVEGAVARLGQPERCDCRIDEGARWVCADAGLLDRVLNNIVENALRYQPSDAPVKVTGDRLGDQVEIRVADTGPGVGRDDLERIFEPFQRAGDVDNGPGLGLGLAVARGLAEAMEGEVTAEPTPGGGLTIVVTLPTTAGTAVVVDRPARG